jgi:uroporphyrinogen III methyltransferase/synthase
MSGAAPLAVVTREAEAAPSLVRALAGEGLRTWCVPTVATAPPPHTADLDAAIDALSEADWLVFTSVRAVDAMCRRQAWSRLWPHVAGRVRVASVGPATSAALEAVGVTPAVRAAGPGSTHLLRAMRASGGIAGAHIVWPRSDVARQEWTALALDAGARVTAPVAYCTVAVPVETLDRLTAAIISGEVGAVTFCSPSSATSLSRAFADGSLRQLAGRVVVAALGPTTAEALSKMGAAADVVASAPVVETLAAELARHFAASTGAST